MINKENFLQLLEKHPVEQNELLNSLEQLYDRFPASSTINFLYLRILKNINPVQFELLKPKLLLTIIDRQRFIEKKFSTEVPKINPIVVEVVKVIESQMQQAESSMVDVESEKKKEDGDTNVIDSLIAKFSKETPKIKYDPERHDGTQNYGKSSLTEDSFLVSETLARIYAQQGYYGKAIKIYKKLDLIFPEKSCYFADQINNLKNRVENNK
ncbi:MAG: hypothetical protein LBU51_04215 [Bacteroidales bacterium]|jgi:tetratricopeptide (TPR) repeat protein|nr:hypothetical protein [Bacteroidales bacterium]